MYKRKYKQGIKIESFTALFHFLDKTGFIYARNKIYQKGWVLSWLLNYVKSLMPGGYINRALKIKKGG